MLETATRSEAPERIEPPSEIYCAVAAAVAAVAAAASVLGKAVEED